MSRARILVVEDDPRVQTLLCQLLGKEGYATRSADTLFKARGQLHRNSPDLVLLDRKLPDGDGLDLCRAIKSSEPTQRIPVLFLTAKDSTVERVVGLKIGGDDYLVKPFQSEELLARIEVLLRRTRGEVEPAERLLSVHGVTMDLDKHECRLGAARIRLWPKEFEMLKVFLERPGRLLSKEFLSERIWGHDFFSSSRAIDTSVQRLRRRLGSKGHVIETIKGYGYKMQAQK